MRVPEPPESLNKNSSLFGWSIFDEFSRLLVGLGELIQKINRNYKISRFWTFQLAHELKTPLSILSVEIENAESSGTIHSPLGVSLRNELQRATDVVSSFLSWAELEHANPNKMLYANRISNVLSEIVERTKSQYGNRLAIHIKNEIEVLAHPAHIQQILLNLIINALKYSPSQELVTVTCENVKLTIVDRGPGIPALVLTRLGEPFNRGPNLNSPEGGHGLGLAWAYSVSKLYGWNLDILAPEGGGTAITIEFPAIN